jgi:hypothetical protein
MSEESSGEGFTDPNGFSLGGNLNMAGVSADRPIPSDPYRGAGDGWPWRCPFAYDQPRLASALKEGNRAQCGEFEPRSAPVSRHSAWHAWP